MSKRKVEMRDCNLNWLLSFDPMAWMVQYIWGGVSEAK